MLPITSVVSSLLSGGKATGAGQAGFPQHTQEADSLSAGPARRGRGQEVCEVALGEQRQRRIKLCTTSCSRILINISELFQT